MAAPKANPTSLLLASASSQYVSIADNTSLKPTGNFTIRSRFKSSTTGVNQRIFQSGSQNTNVAGIQLFVDSTNKVRLQTGKNTGVTQGTDWQYVQSNATVCDGHWHDIIGIYDGTKLYVYIDRALDNSLAWTTNPAYAATNYVNIGVQETAPATFDGYVNGNLNNIELWSIAISAGQIAEPAKDITGSANLVAWWRCNDTKGTTLTDVVGGFNGTLQGSAGWSTDVPFTVHESTANSNEAFNTRFFTHPNLVALYRLENVNDSKGTRNLTNNGAVVFDTGKYGNAADGGASNTAKYLSNTTDNYGIDGGNITMSAWIQANGTPANNTGTKIVEQGSATSHVQNIMDYRQISGVIEIHFGRFKSGVGEQSFDYVLTLDGNFHLITYTYDGSTVRGYIDGVFIGSVVASGSGSSGITSGVSIFSDFGAATTFFSGKIDDVQIYNVALSDADIMDLYIGKKVASTEFSTLSLASDGSLVSYYKAENTSDSKGTNTLTNNGTTPFNPAKFNNGFDFGSGNTTKSMTLANAFSIPGNGDFSISMWVKSYGNPTSGNISALFIERTQTTSDRFIQAYAYNNSGAMQVVLDNSNGFAGAGKYNYTFDTVSFHHVVITRTGASDAKVYIDGQLVINGLAQGTSTAGTTDFELANNGGTPSGQWIIDDIPVLSRPLTPDEVALIFYGAGSVATIFPSLMLMGVGS